MMAKMFIPPGDYYCIKPPAIPCELLEKSWISDAEKETINGIGAKACGLNSVVTPASSPVLRRAVECIAYYFRREFGYDFLQYCSLEMDDDGHRAYIWADPCTLNEQDKITVFGACCFRWRTWKDAPSDFPSKSYALQWIWLHPYQRRKGILDKAWPYFLARFDPFVPEGPHSPAMQGFLRKHHYDRFIPSSE
jgi:hypothetical protein